MKRSRCHEDIKESLPFRIFAIEVDDLVEYWVHHRKANEEFQKDIHDFVSRCKNMDPNAIKKNLPEFLEGHGYIPLTDLVPEEYRGRILSTRARIVRKD